jgi:hypothetical protein
MTGIVLSESWGLQRKCGREADEVILGGKLRYAYFSGLHGNPSSRESVTSLCLWFSMEQRECSCLSGSCGEDRHYYALIQNIKIKYAKPS